MNEFEWIEDVPIKWVVNNIKDLSIGDRVGVISVLFGGIEEMGTVVNFTTLRSTAYALMKFDNQSHKGLHNGHGEGVNGYISNRNDCWWVIISDNYEIHKYG